MRITYLQNHHVEIIKQGTTKGNGIKETLAYDTPLSREGLETWRNEFWATRISGSKQIWELLKNACDEDEDTAMALISAVGL